MSKELMSVDDVSRKLGLHKNTVYRLIRKKEIPSKRIGRKIVIPKEEFKKYISKVD